jgi:hypothetical protein
MTKSPSIERVLRGLPTEHQNLIRTRYEEIIPILLRLMKPRDVLERNRAWPGVKPMGNAATKLLLTKNAGKVRRAIRRHTTTHHKNSDEFWRLMRAYCQHGPIALVDAVETNLQPLIAEELLEIARFHRLGKHPRSDAGTYIRELLNLYADELGLEPLPNFVARYAFVTNRKLKHWFTANEEQTEHVPKATKRLNRELPYPHEWWNAFAQQLKFRCALADRHSEQIFPWLLWIKDATTGSLQGVRLCAKEPKLRDFLLLLRWSIWHYEAPWWPSRGIPDSLSFPIRVEHLQDSDRRALTYTHTEVVEQAVHEQEPLPDPIKQWVSHQEQYSGPPLTLKQCQNSLRSYLHELQSELISAPTPSVLSEQGVSLPWSSGIASALLIPSAGMHEVEQGLITLWGVPYNAIEAGLKNGEVGNVRYDPDDARSIYFILGKAKVAKIEAARFEGERVTWLDLVEEPESLHQQ